MFGDSSMSALSCYEARLMLKQSRRELGWIIMARELHYSIIISGNCEHDVLFAFIRLMRFLFTGMCSIEVSVVCKLLARSYLANVSDRLQQSVAL